MKYRKKPVVIDAFQLPLTRPTESDDSAIGHAAVWLFLESCKGWKIANELGEITIPTLEGDHKASLGDYIIKGIKGEFYPCKPDIFEATYEKVEP